MFFVATLVLTLGLFLFIGGLGFLCNFLGFMIRGTAMSWGGYFYTTLLASVLLVVGGLLLLHYIPLTIALLA